MRHRERSMKTAGFSRPRMREKTTFETPGDGTIGTAWTESSVSGTQAIR